MAMKPINVTQLNKYVKRIIQTDPLLGNVSVIGEISNLKFHSSGHVYFSLKDSTSRINCFLGAQNINNIRFELEEGMEITAIGFVSVYEPGGYYSLNIKDIEVSGQGNLSLAFEKLKCKLEKKGYFLPENKKKLPVFPQKIAVVTSKTGAAVKDIVKIITAKNNYVDILIYPVLVQGKAAGKSIAEAIDHLNGDFDDVDLMIVGRGGGAAEDLWAFNEEIVAESIFKSKIPVISAVGHEMDFTICDFVADVRAETPTAGANVAVPDINEIKSFMKNNLERLTSNATIVVRGKENTLKSLDLTIFKNKIIEKINSYTFKTESLNSACKSNIHRLMSIKEQRIMISKKVLDSLNPANIMKRGYSVVLDENNKPVTNLDKIKKGDSLKVLFNDGSADVKVESVRRKENG